MLDDPSVTAKKIRSAVTDDEREVRFDRGEKPGDREPAHHLLGARRRADSRTRGEVRSAAATATSRRTSPRSSWKRFGPIRARALELLDDPAELDRVLAGNADRAAAIANVTLAKVYDKIGLLPRSRP